MVTLAMAVARTGGVKTILPYINLAPEGAHKGFFAGRRGAQDQGSGFGGNGFTSLAFFLRRQHKVWEGRAYLVYLIELLLHFFNIPYGGLGCFAYRMV